MADNKIAMLVLVAVGIIVGLIVFEEIAAYVSSVDDTRTFTNTTYAAPAAGAYSDISGCQEVIGTYTVTNATSGVTVDSGNITLVERVGTDGLKTVSIYSGATATYASKNVNISHTCGVDGYVEDSGARGVIGLIVILGAIAIAIFAMVPAVRDPVMDYVRG